MGKSEIVRIAYCAANIPSKSVARTARSPRNVPKGAGSGGLCGRERSNEDPPNNILRYMQDRYVDVYFPVLPILPGAHRPMKIKIEVEIPSGPTCIHQNFECREVGLWWCQFKDLEDDKNDGFCHLFGKSLGASWEPGRERFPFQKCDLSCPEYL